MVKRHKNIFDDSYQIGKGKEMINQQKLPLFLSPNFKTFPKGGDSRDILNSRDILSSKKQ